MSVSAGVPDAGIVAAPRRVGLFGGSFDPPHHAHLALAHAALQALALDELRWMPAGQPWQKPGVSAAGHREAMVRLAIAGEPRFVLERCELERGGVTYTVDTLVELQAREAGVQWFLVIGADQFARLPSWHRWAELLGRVTLAVAPRPGVPLATPPEVAAAGHAAVPIALPPMADSASEVRQRVARGESITHLVPAAVAGYIARHALYGATNRS